MEWMSEAAIPLPAVVLSRLLGLPDEAAEFVRDFGYASGEQISGFASEASMPRDPSDHRLTSAPSRTPTGKHVPPLNQTKTP